jgi:arginyl-tRNA synthetase
MASDSTVKLPKKEFPPPPSLQSLQEELSSLGIDDKLPEFAESNPTTNPVDVYRCYISHVLAPITGVDFSLVYPALEWTQSFEKGDLILAAPRLRIKGRKPDELVKEWSEKVRAFASTPCNQFS